MSNLHIAVVCSSNMNRSMEAHAFLIKNGFKVKSFGTGDKVKLPGPPADGPNCYEFGVPYGDMYNDLLEKNRSYYTQNGILSMLIRNKRIKPYPEKFQVSTEMFDVIITCEKRVYDQVIEWFVSRKSDCNQPVHIINVDIPDNYEDAILGAICIEDMVIKMARSDDLDNDIDELLNEFEAKCQQPILNCVMSY